MDLGLFMMPLHPPERALADCYDDDLKTLVLGNRLGFREAWVGEHFTSRWENNAAPDLLMAKALPLTERISFGTGVACLAYQHPFVVAHRMAVFDHLARGRFIFGIGPGALLTDLATFGLAGDDPDPRDLARESIQVILQLWQSEGEFEFHGKFWQIHPNGSARFPGTGLFLKPYQRPHPPIAVAGSSMGSKTLEIAGEHGWIPMSINFTSVSTLRTHWASVERGAARTGRRRSRTQWRIAREVYVAPTTAEARDQAVRLGMGRAFQEYTGPVQRAGRGLARFKDEGDATPDAAIGPAWLLEHLWIVGSPDDVAAQLRRLYHRVGGFGSLLVICHDMPPDLWERSLTLLAREVMPQLADLAGAEAEPAATVAGRPG